MVQVYCRDLLIGIGSWCMFQHIYYKAIRSWSHYIETLKPWGFFLLRIGRQGGSDLWGYSEAGRKGAKHTAFAFISEGPSFCQTPILHVELCPKPPSYAFIVTPEV